ncbi:MAG: monovalent cation/H(+) antiporter subunit G [Yaniella sp.]|nr:monovalent cation/H(+) antiporter subunit G [Yaniella sp.]
MDMTAFAELFGNLFIIAGVLIFTVAVVGLYKFTDTYQRISAVGTAAGLGISLVVIGVFFEMPSWPNFVKLLIILFLQLATSSIGTMAIARSAYLTGAKMQPGHFDHLAEDQLDTHETVHPDEDEAHDTDDIPSDAGHESTD